MSQDEEVHGYWLADVPLPPNFPEGHNRVPRKKVPNADNIYDSGSFDFYMGEDESYWGVSGKIVIAWIQTERELSIEEIAAEVRAQTRLNIRRN